MKGYVYFFRQVGSPYVKIGFTNSESVASRFAMFKMYAPMGANIEAVIETAHAKDLESELHKKYKAKRVGGEFFQMTAEEVESVRLANVGTDERDLRNEFEMFISKASCADMAKLKKMIGKHFEVEVSDRMHKATAFVIDAVNQRFVGQRFTATDVQNHLMDTIDEMEDLPSLKEIGQVLRVNCTLKSFRSGDEVRKMYYTETNIEP
jgi:hypothetical protein